MISDFQQLSDKISQLTALAESLRRENGELRKFAASLTAEREELTRRMAEASQRVEALLESIPAIEHDAEAA
ncbi:MAG: DUF904 domain-containing protein [Janthinobacterium lividum]